MGVGATAGSPAPLRLVDRRPGLDAHALVERLQPPRRFAGARFSTFEPNPEHPSQAAALAELRSFAAGLGDGDRRVRRWFSRRPDTTEGSAGPAGRYLDGGFGVGKTHLLAALWHDSPVPAAYLTFAELTALIGFLGMDDAVAAFRPFGLLCIDEFELDDVANTLMAVTFLRHAVRGGARVVTTSNTLPDRLGEGRFHAADFRREIAAIAEHFAVVRIDGPDYRARSRTEADTEPSHRVRAAVESAAAQGRRVSEDTFAELLAHLRRVHPVQYQAMVEDLDGVALLDLAPVGNQGDALLLVHLVDELYDAGIPVAASGCEVSDLFPEGYRHGGYRKKYGRCESRLAALLGEWRWSDEHRW